MTAAIGAAELAATMAGAGILLLSFALSRVLARAATGSRLDTFVRQQSLAPRTSVRLQSEPRSALADRINRRLRRASATRRLQVQLIRAGLDIPATRFLMLQGIVACAAFLGARTLVGSAPAAGETAALMAGSFAAGFAWFVPVFWLRIKESRRQKRFEQQLAPAIDAMAGALQAGSSLPQAMEMISREMPEPIGEELAVVVREMAVGVPMDEAFDNMLTRVRSLDLDMLLTAIKIQYRVGGNLSQILRSISHTIRERLRIRGEISVLTAQARISAYLVSGLPLVIIMALFLIAPNYIMKLFLPGITRTLLVGGVLGIATGFYCMRKIADIDV